MVLPYQLIIIDDEKEISNGENDIYHKSIQTFKEYLDLARDQRKGSRRYHT
jgi:hypothetical protein